MRTFTTVVLLGLVLVAACSARRRLAPAARSPSTGRRPPARPAPSRSPATRRARRDRWPAPRSSSRPRPGVEIARLTTAADGTFSVDLARRATTALVPQPVEGILGTADQVTVTVPASGSPAPAEILVRYDTGIR